jgi:hypothetical protein
LRDVRQARRVVDLCEDLAEDLARVGKVVWLPIDELRRLVPRLLRQPIEGDVARCFACGGVGRRDSFQEDEVFVVVGAKEDLRTSPGAVWIVPIRRERGGGCEPVRGELGVEVGARGDVCLEPAPPQYE